MSQQPHILIADDERSIRLMLETGLTLNGFRVTSARNGREALDLANSQPFDAVLSDINMPEMDGEEMLRQFSLDEALSAIPVIVVSTDASGSRIERMKALGARGYLGKPFRPEQLRAAVEDGIGAGYV